MSEPGLPAQRASDDDRDRAVELLRHASVDGRLDLEELAERTERAQLARTRGELAELTTRGPFGTLNVRSRLRLRDTLRDGVKALTEGLMRTACAGAIADVLRHPV